MMNLNIKRIRTWFLITLPIFVMISCATDKDKWLNRNYHAMTTRFNGYFNGNESLKEGVQQISNSHVDDFTKILPVFRLGDKDIASASNSYMDIAISKSSVQIKRHSMFIRGDEKNNWIDDCWLLIGKAYFYKQDYDLAKQNFDFIIARYNKKSIRYDATLWKIMTNTRQGEFGDSEALFGLLQKAIRKGQTSRKVKKMYPLVRADFFIEQENYTAAIEPLQNAIKANRKKSIRQRSTFILAQILQKEGKLDSAAERYKQVIKMNPPYEMAFNAKISLAKCFKVEEMGSRYIKRYLNRMIKDEKNKEYLDQVYYALADVYLKEKDEEMAVKMLKLSVARSIQNPNQKAISSLQLADIYFASEQYENAQAYYDSAVVFLQKDYPDYDKIVTKKDILTNLVENILVVQRQDSLQELANMSEGERMKIIRDLIDEIVEQEERERQEKIDRQQSLGFLENENRERNNTQAGGGWYFSEAATRSFGYTEFKKKWGERKLEDLWRLSSVSPEGASEGPMTAQDSIVKDSLDKLAKDKKDPNFYLRDIPLTPEQMTQSNNMIEQALYNMGYIYFHDLKDYDKAIEAFGEQLSRFEKGKLVPLAFYQLYHVYGALEFPDKVAFYKDELTTKYPDHDYARILDDPDYFKKKYEKKNQRKEFYSRAYSKFDNKEYNIAIEMCDSALSDSNFVELHPRFALLKAITTGEKADKDNYIKQLEFVANSYPDTEEGIYADQILNYLKPKATAAADPTDGELEDTTEKVTIDYSIYKFNKKTTHLVIFIIDTRSIKIDQFKNKLSDYNSEAFSLSKLSISNTILGPEKQMVTVSNFKDGEKAMDYYNAAKANAEFLATYKASILGYWPISSNNYPVFFRDKDVEKYNAFFKDTYLKED